jgi:hypothetical protein
LKSTVLPGFERPGSSNIEIDPEHGFCNAPVGRNQKVGTAGLFYLSCCPYGTYPKINEVGSFSPPQLQFALIEMAETRRSAPIGKVLLTTC